MAARLPAPLWLTQHTRFAALDRSRARLGALLLALLLAATLTALRDASQTADHAASHNQSLTVRTTDIALYQSIVEGVRHGGNYYSVAADALRTNGYPLHPFVAMRLPTLAVVEGALPEPVTRTLLVLLVITVMMAWYVRLRPTLKGPLPLTVTLILLAGGMAVFVQRDMLAFHEIWAGPLIALSLALRRPGRWIEAVAVAMIALLIRETTALYVGIMALFALIEGDWRETAGWGFITAVFAGVIVLHAHAVAEVVRPLDGVSPGWNGLLGFGYFIKTMALSTALILAPLWLAAPLAGLALFGWAGWRDPLGLRVLAVLCGYAALLSLFARADNVYWALMIAPLLLPGLVFAPDALRELITRALDRRRITVTRSVR